MDFTTWLQQQGLTASDLSQEELSSWYPKYQAAQGGGSDAGSPASPAQPYQDIAYWQGKGYGTNDMFDANGQTKPGWSRTGNGYEYDPSQVPGPSGGGGGGGGSSAAPTPFAWPSFNAPSFAPATPLSAPNPYVPTTFSYGDFKAPTLEEAQNQPGYKFGLQQGQDAAANAAARYGTLRGGGFLKDLFNYTNAAAEQNYGNVYNQDLNTYSTNRGNAFTNWSANELNRANAYGVNWAATKDVNTSQNAAGQQDYSNAYQNAVATFNPQFSAAQSTFADSYNRWLAKLNSLTQLSRPV